MRLLLVIAAAVLYALISGCAAVAVGGAAAAGGYLVGEDRRPADILADDQAIEFRIHNRVAEKHPTSHVNATSYNRMVLLTGEAPSVEAKADIEKIARGVNNVRNIYNELQIAGSSSFPSRANDSYITSKVKARFLDARRFNPVHVKVVTENNTVYLMGIVKKQEANDATEISRTTSGVQRVVRVFEYQD